MLLDNKYYVNKLILMGDLSYSLSAFTRKQYILRFRTHISFS